MKKRPDRKADRQQQALERQAYWSSLEPAVKIRLLDHRLGREQGAKKQRAKYAKNES